jgi:hypothetical protein
MPGFFGLINSPAVVLPAFGSTIRLSIAKAQRSRMQADGIDPSSVGLCTGIEGPLQFPEF